MQLSLGQAEVGRGGVVAAEEAEVPEPAVRAEKERIVARVEALLERIAFGFGDPARRDCRVDAVAERFLQCVAELARRDAELLRSVVDDRLVLLPWGGVGGGDRNAASGRREQRRGESEHELVVSCHAPSVAVGPKNPLRGT